ncbi:MAG: hypothetical protein ACOC6Q_02990 [Patescibacteria group bacterium]
MKNGKRKELVNLQIPWILKQISQLRTQQLESENQVIAETNNVKAKHLVLAVFFGGLTFTVGMVIIPSLIRQGRTFRSPTLVTVYALLFCSTYLLVFNVLNVKAIFSSKPKTYPKRQKDIKELEQKINQLSAQELNQLIRLIHSAPYKHEFLAN